MYLLLFSNSSVLSCSCVSHSPQKAAESSFFAIRMTLHCSFDILGRMGGKHMWKHVPQIYGGVPTPVDKRNGRTLNSFTTPKYWKPRHFE